MYKIKTRWGKKSRTHYVTASKESELGLARLVSQGKMQLELTSYLSLDSTDKIWSNHKNVFFFHISAKKDLKIGKFP